MIENLAITSYSLYSAVEQFMAWAFRIMYLIASVTLLMLSTLTGKLNQNAKLITRDNKPTFLWYKALFCDNHQSYTEPPGGLMASTRAWSRVQFLAEAQYSVHLALRQNWVATEITLWCIVLAIQLSHYTQKPRGVAWSFADCWKIEVYFF